jgi:hypothetical protein
MYGNFGESVLSAENASKAYQLRDHASDEERFFISASYDMQVTGNLEKAHETCELWAQSYPRVVQPHGFLAGVIYPAFGRYEKSIQESKIVIGLNPDYSIGYEILVSSYLSIWRIDEAERTLQRAFERKLETSDFLIHRYDIAFLKDNKLEMERHAAEAKGNPEVEDEMSNSEGLVLAYAGHLEEARRMSRRAVDLAQQANRRETAALYEAAAALREALFGNEAAARQRAIGALSLSKGRDVQFRAALAVAISGDSYRSQALADDLLRRFPEDTIVGFVYAPTLHAFLALDRGEASKAIEMLQTVIPYEFGDDAYLYPAYVRGAAYLAARQGREAAVEYQKILDHRGVVISDPTGALAHLQSGRAYALAGDNSKAKTAYQDFLTLWKDADPDIPILIAAKSEYAKLK